MPEPKNQERLLGMYAELQAATAFSFLRGASTPEELVETAAAIGLAALGVADLNSVAGVVRAHAAARDAGLRLLVGARLAFGDGTPDLLCYPTDRAAWGRLCCLLTIGKLRAKKGECDLRRGDLATQAEGQVLIAVPPDAPGADFARSLAWLRELAGDRLYLAATRRHCADDARRLRKLAATRRAAADSVAGHQRRALSPRRAPPAAGRADLHPPEDHRSTRRAWRCKPMPSAT